MKLTSALLFRSMIVPLLLASSCFAQAESPATLWSFMGIPQAGRKINGALFNRRGNHPGLEKKPALKGLADPANLESPNPAIKKAAEVKLAEDLKKQKIKAIKYLTSIGCGCYDIDGSITAALLDASEDCTEEVRLATLEAIHEEASGQCCANCGQVCCCNEAMIKRLAAMAYHRDDKGCWLEPSERVREAAALALDACCPNKAPIIEEVETPNPQPIPPPVVPEGIEPPTPEGTDPDGDEQSVQLAPIRHRVRNASTSNQARRPMGVIIHTDSKRGVAHVHLDQPDATARVGSTLLAYEDTPEGRKIVGRFRVYQAFAGSANVQELDRGTVRQIVRGTYVTDDPQLVALGNHRPSN